MAVRAKGKKWQVVVRDYSELVNGKPKWRTWTFETEREARLHDLQLQDARVRKEPIPKTPEEQRITFGELADKWLAARTRGGWSTKTVQVNSDIVRLHLKPVIGTTAVKAITPQRVKRVRTDLEDAGVKAGMVGRSLDVLRRVLAYAVGEEIIPNNPGDVLKVKGEMPSKVRQRVIHPLTPSQIEAIRTKALAQRTPYALRNATMVSVLGYAGVRPAELHGLKWADYASGKLKVVRAVSDGEEIDTKTEASIRTIAVWAPLAEDLDAWKAKTAHGADDDLIFPMDDGTAFTTVDRTNWRKRIWQACAPKGSRPYDARHGHASLLIRAKRADTEIAYRLGHSTVTLSAVYSHHQKEFAEDAEINPIDLILEARGVEDPKAARPQPDGPVTDEISARWSSLSDAQRERALAFVDEMQWNEATNTTVTIPK